MKKKGGGQMAHDLRVSQAQGEQVEASPGEQALAAMDAGAYPERHPITRLIQNRMTDAEQAADFKRRLYEALVPVGALADEMKTVGLGFNMGWGVDTFGRNIPTVTVLRSYP